MTRITTLADAEAVALRAADDIARLLEQAREQRGHAHLALSGGATPVRTYEMLAQTLPSWEHIEVWFVDERCVDPEDEQSNYRLAAQTLLGPAGVPDQRVHRMPGELGPLQGAQSYARQLHDHGPPRLDVAVLGIGPDGHIASLFPHASALGADEQTLCTSVTDSPKPPPERITLTLPALHAARRCLVIATGSEKTGAISAMLGEPTAAAPASLLARDRLSLVLDDAASGAPGEPWLTHSP